MSESELKNPMQPIFVDKGGKPRFKKNQIVKFLLDFASTRGCNMNDLSIIPFSDDDWTQFSQLIGYDICGFGELSYVSDDDYSAAEAMANKALEDVAAKKSSGCS